MTFSDFLYQASFWQWVGVLILAGYIAKGVAGFRLWGNITKTVTETKVQRKDNP